VQEELQDICACVTCIFTMLCLSYSTSLALIEHLEARLLNVNLCNSMVNGNCSPIEIYYASLVITLVIISSNTAANDRSDQVGIYIYHSMSHPDRFQLCKNRRIKPPGSSLRKGSKKSSSCGHLLWCTAVAPEVRQTIRQMVFNGHWQACMT
jgi:hypothetical protein